jgi:hypothetical protein
VHSHFAALPPSPQKLWPEIPDALSEIFERVVSKDLNDRYGIAEGLLIYLWRCKKFGQDYPPVDVSIGLCECLPASE